MDQLVYLIVPFIALVILSVLCDKIVMTLEFLLHNIPHLPDFLEPGFAYIITLALAIGVCWLSQFDIFTYLDINFPYNIGVFLTGVIISQGSSYVKNVFGAVNDIPSVFSGIMSSVKSIFKK